MIEILLALQLSVPGRTYHPVPLGRATSHTHIRVCGVVQSVRKQKDGDIHINLSAVRGGPFLLVGEIIPLIPLPRPRLGTTICLEGISRTDAKHKWPEIHPVEGWYEVKK